MEFLSETVKFVDRLFVDGNSCGDFEFPFVQNVLKTPFEHLNFNDVSLEAQEREICLSQILPQHNMASSVKMLIQSATLHYFNATG